MKVTFLGTGEACDPSHPNTSILIDDGSSQHLLDCGFTAALPFLRQCRDKNSLAGIWLSHFHGDHFFGLPQLILGLHQMGRSRPLTILAGTLARNKTEHLIDMAYPHILNSLQFPLHYLEVPVDSPLEHGKLLWQAAPTAHSQDPFGVRLQSLDKRLYYSGDGKASPEARRLMHRCDLVIHEAFSLNDSLHGHGSITDCIHLAAELKIPEMALVHLSFETRRNSEAISALLKNGGASTIFVPEENDRISL